MPAMRCGGQPENCCSGRFPSLPRRRNEDPGGSYPSAMLRLLTAALLARTAHGSCVDYYTAQCMKYLDETWAGRGQHACNQTWAEAQGYGACPPPETCDFALAQQGDDTCKPARCQESGCCNSSDIKWAEQYGSDSCPPQTLSWENGMYLYPMCLENIDDLCSLAIVQRRAVRVHREFPRPERHH